MPSAPLDAEVGRALSESVGRALRERGLTIATAESCTGGLVGALITAIAGSSDYYVGGAVTYADAAKELMLGVSRAVLDEHGAVSEEAARAMAEGIRSRLSTDIAISTTGIAGPSGGSDDKPVGLVYIGIAGPVGTSVRRHVFAGNRDDVRARAAEAALRAVLELLGVRTG